MPRSFPSRLFEHPGTLLLLLIPLLLFAQLNGFSQDDAFISFRYALNWYEHGQPTWNPGEQPPIEGYTNFLWVALLRLWFEFSPDALLFVTLSGWVLGGLSLWLTYLLGLRLLPSAGYALLTVLLLGCNLSFSAYITGGLETQLQCTLVLAIWWLYARNRETPVALEVGLASILAALAVMTRIDSVVWLAVPGMAFIWQGLRRPAVLAALLLPFAALVGGWLWWKWGYYGALLPNTYHVKTSSLGLVHLVRGLFYVGGACLIYGLWLAAAHFFTSAFWRGTDAGAALFRAMMLATVLWMAYLVRVGGDFMELRMMVPAFPLLYLAVVRLMAQFRDVMARVLVAGLLLTGSMCHALWNNGPGWQPLSWLEDGANEWSEVGQAVYQHFGDPQLKTTIAVTAAGAVPYYSKLRSIDMMGLNDFWIARNGTVVGYLPGHQRRAPLSYLMSSGVNLVLAHPVIVSNQNLESSLAARGYLSDFMIWEIPTPPVAEMPPNLRVVLIPLADGRSVPALYLQPTPAIDAVIEQGQMKLLPFQPSADSVPFQAGTPPPLPQQIRAAIFRH